tara:strand:+ start:1252 stop:1881 length:630 start_codon:yes stop_codon:yes gene_type:complete
MKKELQKRILSSLVLIPTALIFIIKGSYFFNFFILICLFISLYEWHYISKKKEYKIPGIIFLFFSFYAVFEFRDNESYKDFLFIITICVLTDLGGYIFGKIFKGPKLTRISPKKTFVGVFGGFFLSLLGGLVFYQYEYTDQISNDGLHFLMIILFISLISQVGDLIISYFKRKAKIKDTGKILPGHGGLLDRIDGMIFVFPIFYLITIL